MPLLGGIQCTEMRLSPSEVQHRLQKTESESFDGAVSALRRSAVVIAGFNTAGFAVTALTQSHKITDLTVRPSTLLTSAMLIQMPLHTRVARMTLSVSHACHMSMYNLL